MPSEYSIREERDLAHAKLAVVTALAYEMLKMLISERGFVSASRAAQIDRIRDEARALDIFPR